MSTTLTDRVSPPALLARLTGAPDRMIDVGHAQLAYLRFGEGPDLAFIHGWPLTQATWRHLATPRSPATASPAWGCSSA